jgi:hypothetical protein
MQSYANWRTGSWQVRLNIGAYYLQRLVTSPLVRRLSKHFLVFLLRVRHRGIDNRDEAKSDTVIDLEKQGFAFLGHVLSEEECASIREYLSTKVIKDVRETGSTFDLGTIPPGVKLGDYTLGTVVNCPKIMQIANRPDLLALAAGYLGFTPTITNISLRWSFPTEEVALDIQQYHRDCEPATLKIMIYLTNVDLDAGPHVYIPRTHKDRKSIRLRSYPDEEVSAKYGDGILVTGSAGTAFAIDPSGIHKGVAPRVFPRLLLCIQYSLVPALIYSPNPVQYSGHAELNAYVNRLVVSFA